MSRALADALRGDGELINLARAYVQADGRRWASLREPPYNERKGARHWRLCEAASAAWADWAATLRARGVQVGDRRALAVALSR